ncbi:MAG: bifunctional aconitate hydratase 2/2-methylisocitrate dehydratase [Spirochaetia bacterium]|nr:bifunctional aconitate hydratase 2/2-methylisocitrate dehydratase [Spirochaetia bacterium]
MSFLAKYDEHVKEREAQGIPPLPLTLEQTSDVVELLKAGKEDAEFLKNLLFNRVNPGVDDAARLKAAFLNDFIQGKTVCKGMTKKEAVSALAQMLGGYNIKPLIDALNVADAADDAVVALSNTLLVYDEFNTIAELSKKNAHAKKIMQSWANGEWFLNRPALAEKISVSVLKVPGETNTDDLSPASEAFTRSDIPLHAKSMLVTKMPEGLKTIAELKKKGHQVAYVGDVVGTGSSRKSGVNSVQWHMGDDIPGIPNKRTGGLVLGTVIAPIFFSTCEDSGSLPIQCNVDSMETGDVIDVYVYKGIVEKNGKKISEFKLEPNTILEEVRAGGRVPLIIGRGLTNKARKFLGMPVEEIFSKPDQPKDSGKGYTLAQKMVGQAVGLKGVKPGMYVEPATSTVGSQDTTGAMTRDEVKELSALGFNADFVLQSFCHTAAYPKPADIKLHHSLPDFITTRGGVSLRPGDGIIHSWLNRTVLPDTVGTGGDSHTRFPVGISFPAGSGLVAFAAVTGSMPLTMPESVLVRFKGKMQPGITLRDLVNAIPYVAIKQGLLTVPKKNKKNIFNGRILEIEGLPDLKAEQSFELSDASAERSAAACTVALNKEPVMEYIKSNITLLEAMIKFGYSDAKTLQRRADAMKKWLSNPVLLQADKDAEYAAVIEIDMNEITEPILACPNDPDDVATLSEIQADPNRPKKIDEVFVGSCMTNIGHYRALGEILKGEGQSPSKLWIVPPTKMDERQLVDEGYYSIFGGAGARTEVPGCSLCMGNQARVADNAVVYSTSTRNFNDRMGKDAKVYLGSAELGAVTSKLGRLPTKQEYLDIVVNKISGKEDKVYKYLNFNEIKNYELKNR